MLLFLNNTFHAFTLEFSFSTIAFHCILHYVVSLKSITFRSYHEQQLACQWGLKYVGCIPGMTLNGIWCWGFSSEDLGNVEDYFIVITPSSTQTRRVVPVRILGIAQIDLFKNYSDLVRLCTKRNFSETTNFKYERTINVIP